MVFAGFWRVWEREGRNKSSCAIVTCAANHDIAHIHHRMPVILRPEAWALWLGEEGHGAARFMQPAPANSLRSYRVHPKVNSNRAEGPDLIAPI